MTDNDYYGVLGISRSAAQDDIKSAYRKLAIKYHPDKNRGNQEAEERFKKATEAYEVLSDTQKRSNYDRFGKAGVDRASGGNYGYKAYTDFSDIFDGFEDVFSNFFGGSSPFGSSLGGRSRQQSRRGADLRYNLEITLEDAALGKEVKIEIPREETCEVCQGGGNVPGTRVSDCHICGGIGQVRRSQGFFSVTTTCPNCSGRGKLIEKPCKTCKGAGVKEKKRTLHIKIPPGVESGSRLKVGGEGESGPGRVAGNLYVVTQINQHALFQRQGNDLILQVDVPFIESLLGCEIEVPTIEGNNIKMKVPPSTESGQIFRLKGKGMPYLGQHTKGDQHVIINLKLPEKMSSQALKLAKELSNELASDTNSKVRYTKVEL